MLAFWWQGTASVLRNASQRPPDTMVRSLKQNILSAVAKTRRGETGYSAGVIVDAVEKLENYQVLNPPNDGWISSLDGRWSLVYSTRAESSKLTPPTALASAIDRFSSALYKIFFKFLPIFAGSSGADENSGAAIAFNTQEIDLSLGMIVNTVKLSKPLSLTIVVNGEVCVSPRSSSDTVDVVFTSCQINSVVLPLPRPKGSLRTTALVDELRVGRGGQGGLFIVKRI